MAGGLPRLRQAVIAARELDALVERLRDELGLLEPYADPAVAYFGLRNAVFALGDTFLEIVSPVSSGTAAERLLERRGDPCGYMLMFQVDDLAAARERARTEEVREVFQIELEDISEVHLHPADMRGAIVSLSQPAPPESWRWGGPGWEARSAPLHVSGAALAIAGADDVVARWGVVIGDEAAVEITEDDADRGLVEIRLSGARARESIDLGAVRLAPDR